MMLDPEAHESDGLLTHELADKIAVGVGLFVAEVRAHLQLNPQNLLAKLGFGPCPCVSLRGLKDPRTAVGGWLVRPLSLTNAKDFGVTYRADALRGGTAVLQGHLLWVSYLLFAPAFEAISLHDLHPPYD